MNERWLPVVGFEGLYEVSDLGRVKRVAAGKGARPGRILRGKINRDGYVVVSLCNAPAPDVHRLVHVLVLTAFVGPCPSGEECRHLDGIPNNNRLDNLCWGTPEQNTADRIRHGTQACGEHHGSAILSLVEVAAIRSASGSQRAIARRFGVSQQHVSDIKTGKRWAI